MSNSVPDLNFDGPVDISTIMATSSTITPQESLPKIQSQQQKLDISTVMAGVSTNISQQPVPQIQPLHDQDNSTIVAGGTPSTTISQQPLPPIQPLHEQGSQGHVNYKNRLQEFMQKSKLPSPVYQTICIRENNMFRSTVVADGKSFTSSKTFISRKAAEQDVAKIAYEGIIKIIKDCISNKSTDEGFPPIYKDKVFCKNILNDFAIKINAEIPTYDTTKFDEKPTYVSSIVFNGVKFSGEHGRNKKEAEQLAARVVVSYYLANAGDSTCLYEIIKSKAGLYYSKRGCPDVDKDSRIDDNGAGETKNTITGDDTNQQISRVSVTENTITEQAHAANSPHVVTQEKLSHLIAKPADCLPITFVPPSQPELASLHGGQPYGLKRKSKKKKKKANKKGKIEPVSQVESELNIVEPV